MKILLHGVKWEKLRCPKISALHKCSTLRNLWDITTTEHVYVLYKFKHQLVNRVEKTNIVVGL